MFSTVGISVRRGSAEKSYGVSVSTEFPGCCSRTCGAVSRSSASFSATVVTCGKSFSGGSSIGE